MNDPIRNERPLWIRCPITTKFVMALALLVLCVACDRNIEPFEPGEKASAPDLAQIFPGPPAAPESPEDSAANSRSPDRTAFPPSRAEGSDLAAAAGTQVASPIEGTVFFSAESASGRPPGAVLFIIARPQGASGGPPLAVLRVADPEFPYTFSIGPANVMIPSMRFEGAISLSARLDADGNAMTRTADDVSSPTISSLAPGATDVSLELSERG